MGKGKTIQWSFLFFRYNTEYEKEFSLLFAKAHPPFSDADGGYIATP